MNARHAGEVVELGPAREAVGEHHRVLPRLTPTGYHYWSHEPTRHSRRSTDSSRTHRARYAIAVAGVDAQRAYLVHQSHGRGQVVAFAEDPNYRAFCDGLNLLFMNGVFFGPAEK